MTRKWRLIAGSVITLAFLILLFYKTDFTEIIASLKKANYFLVAPAILVYFISFWIKVVRWSYIIKPLKSVPASRLFSINVIGYMVNNLLPGRAGELGKAYLVGKKENISKSAVLGTIVVERLFDGLGLIFIILLFSLWLPLGDFLDNLLKVMTFLFSGLFLFFISIVAFPSLTQKVTAALLSFSKGRWRTRADGIVRGFIEGLNILHNPRRLVIIFAYTLLLWSVEAIVGYLIGISFRLKMPLTVYFIATAAANLATILPASQGGIGPYELFAKQTLVLFGAANSIAVAYAILLHAILMLPLVFLGFVYLWKENISLSQLTK